MKAKIWNKSLWLSRDYKNAGEAQAFSQLLKDSGFTILRFVDWKFLPFGYTALWLLAESHFALHSFPEEEKVYVELSSCNAEYYERAAALLDQLEQAVAV